jgi:hypothetical protein
MDRGPDGKPQGPFAEIIQRMNALQTRFNFDLQLVPRLRLNHLFAAGEADVYPFRTLAWTEPELKLQATQTLISTGDVYIARRDNRYGGVKVFQNLARRSLAGVRGYHYGVFANNADPDYIARHFKAQLLPSNEAVVGFVQLGRAEVGIVPEAIMAMMLEDPHVREALIVSERFDSRVELSHLVRRDGPISVAEMNAVVDLLAAAGDLNRLKARLNIQR